MMTDLSSSPNADLVTHAVEEFQRARGKAFVPPRVVDYTGKHISARVAVRDEKDVLWQFFSRKFPRDFDKLLSAVVVEHFGDTSHWKIEWVPEMESWLLVAPNLWTQPLLNEDHLVTRFLDLVDNALDEVRS